jgi:hypothetical protein
MQAAPQENLQRNITADLRAFTHGLIKSVVTQLEYDGLLDVIISGRADSGDLYAAEARRIMSYIDALWNAFDGLATQIANTPETELLSLREYANRLPAPPPPDYFTGSARQRPGLNPLAAAGAAIGSAALPAAAVPVIEPMPATGADLSPITGRVWVFDDLLPETQRLLLEQWALQTPHWMLANSARDEHGTVQHRIWGASYIKAWQQHGWPGLPPVLYAALVTLFRQLGIEFTEPHYIGLNGQSRGQDASIHVDCTRAAADQLSLLLYIGEDTGGDLLLYDRDERRRITRRIAFRPNRVVVMDGSIPHRALAPNDAGFRMSLIIRGVYRWQPAD